MGNSFTTTAASGPPPNPAFANPSNSLQAVQRPRIISKSGVTLHARIVSASGSRLLPADVSAVSCKVFNLDGRTTTGSPTFAVSDVVHACRWGGPWTADDGVYNVSLALAGENFPDGDVAYQVELRITPVDGLPFFVVWTDLHASAVLTA